MILKTLLLVNLLFVCTSASFGQSILPYEIVINEIMADPSPVVGLPNTEYLELKNTSNHNINLSGCKISDGTSTATITANYTLQADSMVIICTNSAVSQFAIFGPSVGVSNFPSLDNDGDLITLKSKEGKLLHAVQYNLKMYGNIIKQDGGWSLEMIDAKKGCNSTENWKASTDAKGGTPGKTNSVAAVINETSALSLLSAFAPDSITIQLFFNKTMDSLKAATGNNYSISDGIGTPLATICNEPLFNTVILKLVTPLQRNKIYTITSKNISDCIGNSIGVYNNTRVGLVTNTGFNDIVINEILFNPTPNGTDYVELYNRSNNIINAKDLYVANRSGNGNIANTKPISTENVLIFPGDYWLITEDATAVSKNYLLKYPEHVFEIGSMPSYPDDKGNVVVLNTNGDIIDELAYNANWHFALIDNSEGVALERIDFNAVTQNSNNWHSAATGAGYGTPTYQNSQYRKEAIGNSNISIEPKIFSPDNDGFDDVATINYNFNEPGYVCNISIYDASGRLVRNLTKNALCGVKGKFTWDGLDDGNHKLPIGIYVVITEIFNLQGKTQKFKQAVTLARRL